MNSKYIAIITGNRTDIIMLSSEETGTVSGLRLPVSKHKVDEIEVVAPRAFESAKFFSKHHKINIDYI